MAITLTAPFTLIGVNGATVVFDNLEALAAHCLAERILIGPSHVYERSLLDSIRDGVNFDRRSDHSWNTRRYFDWVARDLYGRTVYEHDLPKYRYDAYNSTRHVAQRHAASLGLPIPGTGKVRRPRRWWKSYYRRMQFIAVWRASEAALQDLREHHIKGRLHRSNVLPPNSWDDIPRGGHRDRSWKSSRKTRWREPAVSWRVVREDD